MIRAMVLTGLASIACHAMACEPGFELCTGLRNEIDVTSLDSPGVRTRAPFGDMLGVHSLFWETQSVLANDSGELKTEALSLLKKSGVRLIRQGGGANEIDWQQCAGAVASRKPQKVASWMPPVPCRFGIKEYEKAVDALGLTRSWHVANLVGVEFQVAPVERMAQVAGQRATHTREMAGKGREIHWELGNEVERGRYPWSTAEIIARMTSVGEAIRKADPAVKLVAPVLEYRPANIANEYEYNGAVIRAMKPLVQDFALHTYYENPPEGPSLHNRLTYIRRLTDQIRKQVPQGMLWVTEHARWPKGSPSDGNRWRNNWYQTTDVDGVLATADFLVGMSQIDGVAGAMWHGLRAGPWNFLDVDADARISAGQMAKLFEFLSAQLGDRLPVPAATTVGVMSRAGGQGELRASAFVSPGRKDQLAVVVVNRGRDAMRFDLRIKGVAPSVTRQGVASFSPAVGQASIQQKSTSGGDAGLHELVASARSVTVFQLQLK